ncbi:Thiol-disulfide isomerase or thioredoxin [Spirosomataceae bacterium TFI 002]|nr:Thiol-disulfide isomerase or thioredoxin [Spirosomataceae bacterium TFI 002]
MNKILSIITVFLLSASFCFGQPAYDIKVKLKSGPADKYIHLAHYFGYNQYIKVDSAKLENGEYRFSGDEKLKGGVYLIVLNTSKYYDFAYSGNETNINISADTTDYVGTVKFEGSKENDVLFTYRKFLKDKGAEAAALNKLMSTEKDPAIQEENRQKMMNLQTEVAKYMKDVVEENKGTFAAAIIKANFEPEVPKEIPLNVDGTKDSTFAFRYYKGHFWDNIDFTDERILRTPFYQTKLEKYYKDLVFQIQDSIIIDSDRILKLSKQNPEVFRYTLWWVTNKYENIDIVGLDGVFIHLAENYYLKEADWLDSTQRAKFEDRVRILKPLRTGFTFPELKVTDMNGREFEVKENKSKYTIVYFYDPDCGHCKESAPKLVEFQEKNKGKVSVYNIAVEYELDKIKGFVEKYKTGNMVNAWDAKGRYYFREKFDIYSTPTSYMLNEKKEIIGKRIPIEEFDRFIEFYEKRQQEQAKSMK